MERFVMHLDLDTFFVSVSRKDNAALKDKPVIVGGSSDRGVVASCSYEARTYGVHSAMPMRLARQLCPDAIIVRGDYERFTEESKIVTEILTERAPIVEKASIDEHYLDLSGMDKYFGCMKFATELRNTIIEKTGLPISFGLSINKVVSKIATGQAKPNGQLQIALGKEKAFLAPLSIRKIPMVGEKAYKVLSTMGVQKIATLQQLSPILLQRTLGENGLSIWKRGNAIDDSPVVPYSEQKSMSTENTFEQDTTDMELLRRTLVTMTDELAFQLRKAGRLTACVAVKIRYSDFDTHTQQAHIAYTSTDAVLTEKVLELFRKLYNRRLLIRLVGVKFSALVQGSHQIDLFSDTINQINLMQAMDNIRLRFGDKAMMKAISVTQERIKLGKEDAEVKKITRRISR